MNWQVIKTLIIKDVTLYFRDRFFAIITVLSLVAYAGIYFAMPSSVDETLNFALFSPDGETTLDMTFQGQGVAFESLEAEAALINAVEAGDYTAGVVLPADFSANMAAGAPTELTLYYAANLPAELREAVEALFSGSGFGASTGAVIINQEVIGVDRVGQQIPLRDRALPMFAVLILIIETLGLASLIAEERETRTVRALMVTPMNISGLFVSKGIVGVSLAFSQAALLMLVTGGLSQNPLLVLLILLLGSLLVTGLAFLIASFARDMMSVMGWGVAALLILVVPSFTFLAPGLSSDWVQLVPSYYLIDAVDQIVNLGAGAADITINLLVLLVTGVGTLVLGGYVLREKLYES